MAVELGLLARGILGILRFLGFGKAGPDRALLRRCAGGVAGFLLSRCAQVDELGHGFRVAHRAVGVYLNSMEIIEKIKGHWQLLLITTVVFALWRFDVLLPLKILVVFLHEASHAFAALLTGGSVDELSLDTRQGGHVISRGGSLFWIITAGYLGSLLLGCALFLLGLRTDLDRWVVTALGLTMIALVVFYIRDLFPIVFCLSMGGALLAAARYLDHHVSDLILRIIGLTSMIYVPYDIVSDTILRSHLNSDARLLAENFGGPTIFWGVVWLVLSLVVIVFALRRGLSEPSNIDFSDMRLVRR